MKHRVFTISALLCCAVLTLAPVTTTQAAGRRPSDVLELARQSGVVTRVIDGDTIEVNINGALQLVNYIGIDAPELNQCNGVAARNKNSALVLGQMVRLENDLLDAAPDGSLWRYVYLFSGVMANEELLNAGYARAVNAAPNMKHQGDLNALEEAARKAWRGGWSGCRWKSSVARPAGTCLTISAETFATPVATPPEMNVLRDGECVTIVKAQNAESAEWSGTFVYHPAGSLVKMTNMYLRWKDGVVMVQPQTDGTVLAHVVRYTRPKIMFGRVFSERVPAYVQVQALERDAGRNDMWQIPNPRTWLLRDAGNGMYEAMVDVFVYQSGEMRALYVGPSGYLH